MTNRRSYVLVAPCRDEAKFLRHTLDSIAEQTVPPSLFIVVDDGSTDETPMLLAEYAAKLPYLRIVRRTNRGTRSVGPGVIEAFYAGLDHVNLDDFEYVCKIDLDLDLPPRYFELLMERMEQNPRLGTCSGKPYSVNAETGVLEPELGGDEMSVGMTKFYRVSCFREIGGFVREVMWDGIDCHRCRMLGWVAQSEDAEELRFIHLRPMGSSQQNIWTGRVRWGFGQYFMGTTPLYILASAVYRLPHYPVVFGGVAMMWGYLSSAANKRKRYDDPEFRRYLRAYQRDCLLRGKAAATSAANERGAPIWYATHPDAIVKG